jgi:hypothetical protein
MNQFDWRAFLKEWTKKLLRREQQDGKHDIPQQVRDTNWLGFPGATEPQLALTEARLGITLPPSYREFLSVTNGWRQLRDRVAASAGRILASDEIDWLPKREGRFYVNWMDGIELSGGPVAVPDDVYYVYGPNQHSCDFRDEYLQTALAISEFGDSAIYMLNPIVITAEGEWESWFFATWKSGAARYKSFQEMMQAGYRSFVKNDIRGY